MSANVSPRFLVRCQQCKVQNAMIEIFENIFCLINLNWWAYCFQMWHFGVSMEFGTMPTWLWWWFRSQIYCLIWGAIRSTLEPSCSWEKHLSASFVSQTGNCHFGCLCGCGFSWSKVWTGQNQKCIVQEALQTNLVCGKASSHRQRMLWLLVTGVAS